VPSCRREAADLDTRELHVAMADDADDDEALMPHGKAAAGHGVAEADAVIGGGSNASDGPDATETPLPGEPPGVRPMDGPYGWFVVAAAWITHVVILGSMYSWGIYQAAYTANMGDAASKSAIAVIGTLSGGLFTVLGYGAALGPPRRDVSLTRGADGPAATGPALTVWQRGRRPADRPHRQAARVPRRHRPLWRWPPLGVLFNGGAPRGPNWLDLP